jgi:hypothetical protein
LGGKYDKRKRKWGKMIKKKKKGERKLEKWK